MVATIDKDIKNNYARFLAVQSLSKTVFGFL